MQKLSHLKIIKYLQIYTLSLGKLAQKGDTGKTGEKNAKSMGM